MGGSSKRLDSSSKVSICALPSPITDGCGGGVPASPAGGSTKHGQEPRLDPNPPQVFEPSGQSVTLYAKATGRAVVLGAHPEGWGWMYLRGCCRFTGHNPCFLPLKVLGPSLGPRRARSLALILVLVGLESGLRMQMEAACGPGRYEPGSPWASLFPEPSSSLCQMAVLSLFNDFQCLFYSKTRERVVSGSQSPMY